jgi:hypothetical protein
MDWVAIIVTMFGIWSYGHWKGELIGPTISVFGSILWMIWAGMETQWSVFTVNLLMGLIHGWNGYKFNDWRN